MTGKAKNQRYCKAANKVLDLASRYVLSIAPGVEALPAQGCQESLTSKTKTKRSNAPEAEALPAQGCQGSLTLKRSSRNFLANTIKASPEDEADMS